MAFRHSKIELTVSTLPPSRLFDLQDGDGEIPPNLAAITQLLIQLHAANGDLGWLEDLIKDAGQP